MFNNILLFMAGMQMSRYLLNLNGVKYLKQSNMVKFTAFKDNIDTKIKQLFEELKQHKFNRDECLQHFPGYFHFENDEEKKNKSKLFKITEEVTIEEEPYIFPEFNIVFLIV